MIIFKCSVNIVTLPNKTNGNTDMERKRDAPASLFFALDFYITFYIINSSNSYIATKGAAYNENYRPHKSERRRCKDHDSL